MSLRKSKSLGVRCEALWLTQKQGSRQAGGHQQLRVPQTRARERERETHLSAVISDHDADLSRDIVLGASAAEPGGERKREWVSVPEHAPHLLGSRGTHLNHESITKPSRQTGLISRTPRKPSPSWDRS